MKDTTCTEHERCGGDHGYCAACVEALLQDERARCGKEMPGLGALWAEAEAIAMSVHLDRVREGKYLAQLNRQACICRRCSVEVEGSTAVEALTKVIAVLRSRPIHEPGTAPDTVHLGPDTL